jgi:hypothetical protein
MEHLTRRIIEVDIGGHYPRNGYLIEPDSLYLKPAEKEYESAFYDDYRNLHFKRDVWHKWILPRGIAHMELWSVDGTARVKYSARVAEVSGEDAVITNPATGAETLIWSMPYDSRWTQTPLTAADWRLLDECKRATRVVFL